MILSILVPNIAIEPLAPLFLTGGSGFPGSILGPKARCLGSFF